MALSVAQLLREFLGAVHAVQQPESMAQGVTQLGGGEGITGLAAQGVEPFVHGFVVHETATLHAEELVEVEGISLRVAVDLHTLPHLVEHDVAHAVGVHVEARHGGIGVRAAAFVPVALGAALVGIGPVEDGILLKLLVGKGLERRAAQMERVAALDLVECYIGLVGIHAFVGLVDDEQVPREVRHLLELVVVAAEMDGAFEILQTDKLDAVLCPAGLFDGFDILLARQTRVLTLQKGGDTGDEEIMVGPDKLQIVIVPRVGDGGSVRDDEHVV